MRHKQVIHGTPYFPGIAAGQLCTTAGKLSTRHIALITPEDISHLPDLPAGFIIIDAAPFSHTLITLLGLGIPTVLIESGQAQELGDAMFVNIDGATGRIDVNDQSTGRPAIAPSSQGPGKAFQTADCVAVNLLASVRSASAARYAATTGAKAIGLVRSEFLSPEDGTRPTTVFYRKCFQELLDAAAPLPVTVRLLDVAADKLPAWLPPAWRLGQPLGLQGVRLYNTQSVKQVVQDQLTVLGELVETHTIRLLIPFIVRLEELQYWQTRVRDYIPEGTPIGAMAETLAAVLDISQLLDSADFVAIGCNDLMQAVYSADRDSAPLRHYLDPYAPVLFRLFQQIADNAGSRLDRVQLCGVLPQIRGVLPVLLGLGYRSFSVDAPFIPHLAEQAAGISVSECEALAADICACRTTQEARATLQLSAQTHPPYLI